MAWWVVTAQAILGSRVLAIHGSGGILTIYGGNDVLMRNKLWHIDDICDVADALLLLYEMPEASDRHILYHTIFKMQNPNPTHLSLGMESISAMDNAAPMTSDKLKKLGWSWDPWMR
ncbi:hypothetical protein PR202_ga15422 [Eleusine coracana subsp. coracana]|uniref:Uncharacterized protein n=1 Tax=Eleusine coracana subsp. coracana TaxID=191504 RepID=A0AAV5CK23_ELECO|nr:hypothetical protein PR202_ga15422 [Eleusine coracana subsp. coracana]